MAAVDYELKTELADRRLVPVNQALSAVLGKRPHSATVWRWHRHGVRGHKLPVVRLGGRLMLRLDDLDQFIRAVSGDQPTAPNISARRRREIEAAERECEKAGI
jgi:hypothetical protein